MEKGKRHKPRLREEQRKCVSGTRRFDKIFYEAKSNWATVVVAVFSANLLTTLPPNFSMWINKVCN